MKIALLSRLLPLLAVLALTVATTQAADITWGAVTNITGDSDVSTNGTFVGALNLGGTAVTTTTINGVTFTGVSGGGDNISSGNFNLATSSFFQTLNAPGTVAPYTNLSAPYQALLSTAIRVISTSASTTLTMSGLVMGMTYEFQFWCNTSSSSFDAGTTTAAAGNAVSLTNNTSGPTNGGLGQFAIGTFVADGATQQIAFSGTSPIGGGAILNGFQLRQLGQVTVPETGSTALLLSLVLLAFAGLGRASQGTRLLRPLASGNRTRT